MTTKQEVEVAVLRRTETHLLVSITDQQGEENDYSISPIPRTTLPSFEVIRETTDNPESHVYRVILGAAAPSCENCPGWLAHKPSPCKHIVAVLKLYMRGELYLAAMPQVDPFTKAAKPSIPLATFLTRDQAIELLGTNSRIEVAVSECLGIATYNGDRTLKKVAILAQRGEDWWLLWYDDRRALAHHDNGGFPAFVERLQNLMWFTKKPRTDDEVPF